MKKFLVSCFITCTALGVSLSAQKTPKVLKKYLDAHNAHNVEKVMSFYSDDISFDLIGVWKKSGTDEIRELAEWDAALKSTLAISDVMLKGDSVYCKIKEKNEWFKAIGVEELVHDPVIFIIQDKKIHGIIAYASPEVGMKVGETIGRLGDWSAANGDRTLQELLPGGEFKYSAEAARKWMLLFERWKKESE